MKKLEAIVNPVRFDEVKDELIDLGAKTITATEVKEYARAWTHTEIYRGTTYTSNALTGIKVEVLLDDEQLEEAVFILKKGLERRTMHESDIVIVPVEAIPEYLACSRMFDRSF